MTEPEHRQGEQAAAPTMADLREVNEQLLIAGLREQELAAVLEAERAQLAAILAGIGDAVLVVDTAGMPVRTNAAYRRLAGAADAPLVPQNVQGWPLPPDETPQARAARGETFSMEFTLTAADGSRRWCEANAQPLHEGGAGHAVVVIRDITERSLRRLQDEFLAMVSHELRTPLSAAQGFLGLVLRTLQRDGGDKERLIGYASSALHSLHQLGGLVRDLVDAARLESGKVELMFDTVDLVALVTQTVEMARILPSAPQISLDAATAPLWVRGDASRLEQVVLNLIANAITHAPGPIDLRLYQQGGEVTLEVRDYGPGIAAAALPHLFSRFYQVASGDRSSHGGLGLGLYICRELVGAHGGRIEVASTEGVGTTFTVWLPLLDEA